MGKLFTKQEEEIMVVLVKYKYGKLQSAEEAVREITLIINNTHSEVEDGE